MPRSNGSTASLALLACFFLSGFAALLYQTAWLRQFSLVFGTSELAVAAVLAAYMGGLALGAAIAARYVARLTRPVFAYGVLEAGIAASALAVPFLLAGAGWLYVVWLGDRPELPDADELGQPVFYLIVAFAVLVVPTALMGATLPLLTRHAVRANADVGPRVGMLYATNTAGAVAGTVAAGFVLLPQLGLSATVWSGAAINALVFAIAVRLARSPDPRERPDDSQPPPSEAALDLPASSPRSMAADPSEAEANSAVRFRRGPGLILPLMLVSGANAFYYEVLWTRMLSHVLGGSIYAFATMLAAFLAGIAIGGGWGGVLARERRRAIQAFVVVQCGIALSAIAVYAWMQALVPDTRGGLAPVLYAALVMLPATVFIGATFPLAVRVLAPDELQAGRATARVLSWNTFGAIAGAIAAVFWLLPRLGFAGSIELAVAINLAIALGTAAGVAPRTANGLDGAPFGRVGIGVAASLLAAAVLAYEPGRPMSVIGRTAFELPEPSDGREVYFGVGRSTTVFLTEADGWFDLRTNGLPEAAILPRGAAPVGQTQQWLVGLPLVARPNAETMLLVGLGGGVALESLPASVQHVDAVELEPEVIAANRRLSERRREDPLADPRVKLVVNDARNALRLSSRRYDIVVSQPSHPWTAGASHLFSHEFFLLAKNHLNEGGVFLQWMSASFVDADLLKSLTATLSAAFEHVRLYQPAPSVLLFLASDGMLDPEGQLVRTGRPIRDELLYFSYMRLNGVADLAAALMLDERGTRALGRGAPLTTDDRNRMATGSRSLADGLTAAELDALLAPYDPLTNRDGRIHRELAPAIDFTYVASRLIADGQIARAERLATAVTEPATGAMITGLVHGSRGDLDAARAAFGTALALEPGHAAARYALVQPVLGAIAVGRASREVLALAEHLPPSAAAVVRGWTLAAAQDWRGLSALDRQLAGANVTDLWFPDAARLRADWRTRISNDPGAAFEALRMIDRILPIRPELDLFVLRAAAADVLDDTDAFVESARYAARELHDRLDAIDAGRRPATRGELESAFRAVQGLRARLVELPVDSDRSAALVERMGQEIARIQVLLRP